MHTSRTPSSASTLTSFSYHHLPLPLTPQQVELLHQRQRPQPPPRNQASPKSRSGIVSKRLATRLELYVIPPLVIILILIALVFVYLQLCHPRNNPQESPSPLSPENVRRQDFIRQMARDCWTAYRKYAWGHDALRPLSREPYTDLFGAHSGLGVVSALSTLWIMDLKEEYESGRHWVERELHFGAIKRFIDVQHTVNYFIGGLLSTYALTGDALYLNASRDIADALDHAYTSSPTGLPYWKMVPASGEVSLKTPFLSAVGGQHLEYVYLAAVTGNASYLKRARDIRERLYSIPKPYGLYMHQLDIESGTWLTSTSTLLTPGRTFYSYLLKSYIQSAHTDKVALETFHTALDAIFKNGLMRNSSTSGLLYTRQFHYNQKSAFLKYDKYMNADACALGAMLALAARETADNGTRERYWTWARGIVETCTLMANGTRTGLSPYRFYFDWKDTEEEDLVRSGSHVLSPELAESYFTLYRLTGDPIYQEYAWQYAQALHEHSRVPGESSGYSKIENIDEIPSQLSNLQDVDFLASTLKYLYLIFGPKETLCLDEWVFNARGQPLPICRQNGAFKECKV